MPYASLCLSSSGGNVADMDQWVAGVLQDLRVTGIAAHETPGSIEIDEDLLDAVGMHPYEFVLVVNQKTSRQRKCRVLSGARATGVVVLDTSLANFAAVGDLLQVSAFLASTHPFKPFVLVLGDGNVVCEKEKIDPRIVCPQR